ncbi:hypothetical protein B0H13DRAFT_2428719 [Mycena leptocephala]|nr:hypothetical protein B0H13DRAFT_2428719 [Mycena leptocephala]
MKFLAVFAALAIASVSAKVSVPGEVAYSVSNVVDLPEKPQNVDQELATKLLDVLENYGLTKNFGVVAVHNHMVLADGQVVFQRGNSSFTSSGIAIYNDVKDIGVPYNYRITSGDSPALIPLDLGDNTSGALAARRDLAAATAGNFLKDFAAVAGAHLAGIAYIRPLDRAALENNNVVKNHYNEEKTVGTAGPISVAEAHSDDAPSFFTREVGNSTAASDITILCDVCWGCAVWC